MVDAYRYVLQRDLWEGYGKVLWVMLNPSTATATKDDPTIRRVMGFSRRIGYRFVLVVNLYAARSTNPKWLMKMDDPIGPYTDGIVEELAPGAAMTIVAWGVPRNKKMTARADHVLDLLTRHGDVWRLGDPTAAGHPRHPLYLPADTPLQLHRPKQEESQWEL